MTRQAARALAQRMRTDEAFREQVPTQKDADARIRFINAAGFDCAREAIEPPATVR